MTVYIDDACLPGRGRRFVGRWSHLTADTRDELHAFADQLADLRWSFHDGLAWWRYDVARQLYARAVELGAQKITVAQWAAIAETRAAVAMGAPASQVEEELRGVFRRAVDADDARVRVIREVAIMERRRAIWG